MSKDSRYHVVSYDRHYQFNWEDQPTGWECGKPDRGWDDFKEAIEVVGEWGLNNRGEPRKIGKLGVWDSEEGNLYTQEYCLQFLAYHYSPDIRKEVIDV